MRGGQLFHADLEEEGDIAPGGDGWRLVHAVVLADRQVHQRALGGRQQGDAGPLEPWIARFLALSQVGLGGLARQLAHPLEEDRALRHADGAARIQQVEGVRAAQQVIQRGHDQAVL